MPKHRDVRFRCNKDLGARSIRVIDLLRADPKRHQADGDTRDATFDRMIWEMGIEAVERKNKLPLLSKDETDALLIEGKKR